MKSFIYVMFDELSKSVVRIFLFKNDEVAIRTLKSLINVPNSPFRTNLEDMSLKKLGVLNEESADILSISNENVEEFNVLKKEIMDKERKLNEQINDKK